MMTFDTLDQFKAALGGAKKWDRTLEAIANCAKVSPDVQYSIGDSLTYRRTSELDDSKLTARRRYHAVRYVRAGTATVESASIAALNPVDTYSDLTDRQQFSGEGDVVVLPEGSITVFDIDEAVRDVAVVGEVVTLHVTVEGASFHNK